MDLKRRDESSFNPSWAQTGYCMECDGFKDDIHCLMKEKITSVDSYKNYPSSSYGAHAFTKKKFECPANKCGAENLSPRGFFIGSCCDDAKKKQSAGLEKAAHLGVVTKRFKEACADSENLEKALKNTKVDVENLKFSVQAAHDLLTYAERPTCNVCFESFNDNDRQESTLLCGHVACYSCLAKLLQKHCPTCRKAYTAEQIIRLYKN
ncbi:Oidioi.mRNA.OKI2018_I69.PAR.g10161.t1.cds [Oikopleura dioica]|uniref:Oidioi.mRNA.OKI2018_I69.PAR.g10161.t1.cds n=1 Tax=Oikopleura dioica TaxID=34765 RepID=A0ABN7RP50_OIKDI|nr:Oidioi.mRNA.OKI2018_I69.PAR.g10161.t1.cds [Oikopleura dioica]